MEILSRSVVVEVVYLHGVTCSDAGCVEMCCSSCDVLIKLRTGFLNVFNVVSVLLKPTDCWPLITLCKPTEPIVEIPEFPTISNMSG